MTKRRKRTTKPIPLTIGHDPTLWRYASLQEALAANCDSITQLIQDGGSDSNLSRTLRS